MALRLISILALGVCSEASEIAADFEKACQAGQQDCLDNSEDMYLIQKHVEVGLHSSENEEDPVVTTKGGAEPETKNEKEVLGANAVKCPNEPGYDDKGEFINHYGYEQRFGYTDEKSVFVEAIADDVTDITACSTQCTNRTDCMSFQWETKKSKCYLSTETTPLCNFDSFKNMMKKKECQLSNLKTTVYCAKVDPCTIQLNPFAYWNKTHNLERNLYNAWNTMHRCSTEYGAIVGASWIIWSVLGFLVFQVFFTQAPEVYRDAEDPVDTFEYGHFFCNRREKLCCCAFLAPCALWADTMNLAGFVKPPFSLFLFCVAGLLNALTNWCDNFMFGIFTAMLIVHYRQKLRAKLSLKHSSAATYWNDCVYVFLCPCCAIAQEAQVVRNQLSRVRMAQEKGVDAFDTMQSGGAPAPLPTAYAPRSNVSIGSAPALNSGRVIRAPTPVSSTLQ
jgi:Cys-rich protein (TIGR01571 family)